jgi:hypothetical protein
MSTEEALEAAADAIIDAAFGQELPEDAIDLARAALEAAAPFIAAKALEDAADELARLPYVRPNADGRDEYERLLAVRRGNTDAYLRTRAESIRANKTKESNA